LTNFKYAFDNKRYHTWNYYLRSNFGEKVFKVSINAGFSCPNIDGTVAYGGCTYCSKQGSGDFAGNPNDNLIKQFEDIKEMINVLIKGLKYLKKNHKGLVLVDIEDHGEIVKIQI